MLYKTIIYKNLRSWWIPKPPLSVPVGLKKHWDSTMSHEKKLPTNIKSFLFLCNPIDDFQIISNSPECLTYFFPKSDFCNMFPQEVIFFTHLRQMFHSFTNVTPWNHRKTSGFLICLWKYSKTPVALNWLRTIWSLTVWKMKWTLYSSVLLIYTPWKHHLKVFSCFQGV